MTDTLRVTLEIGKNEKRTVAVAPDWPGLERGAKTEEAALDRLQAYLPRYVPIAKLAGMDEQFAPITTVEVVERYPGTGNTDYWGVSFAFSEIDRQEMSSAELERELTLLQACWAFSMMSARVYQQRCRKVRVEVGEIGSVSFGIR
jgi:hypothetical protein